LRLLYHDSKRTERSLSVIAGVLARKLARKWLPWLGLVILGIATQEQRRKAERSLGIQQDKEIPAAAAEKGEINAAGVIVEKSVTGGQIKLKIRVEIKDPNASFWTDYNGEMVRAAVRQAFLNSGAESIRTLYHQEPYWGGVIHGSHSSSHWEIITVEFPRRVMNDLANPTIRIDYVIARFFHRRGSKPGFYNSYSSIFVPLK